MTVSHPCLNSSEIEIENKIRSELKIVHSMKSMFPVYYHDIVHYGQLPFFPRLFCK